MKCIEVPKKYAERTIKLLRALRIMDNEHIITRKDDHVLIPVTKEPPANNELSSIPMKLIICNPPARKKKEVRVPAHDIIGDIAVVRENVLEYMSREEIVEALRATYPRIRTIYLKKGTEGEFRVAELELLWGVDDPSTIHKEYGLRLKVDLRRAYYNPRLSEEHRRVAENAEDGESIFDLFAGIGGFAIHIASLHKATVLMNDLNPYAVRLGVENILLNKKRIKGTIIPLHMDALLAPKYFRAESFDRVIANIPRSSHLFEKIYWYLLRSKGMLHLYFLSSISERDEFIKQYFARWKLTGVRKVIDYAPYVFIWRADLVKP